MNFQDLTRSGTAPEPTKIKGQQVVGSAFAPRPKTRSLDNDVLDFNIDLRTNKPSQQYYSKDDGNDRYSGEEVEFGHNEDFLQAIESFQADLEDWSGRKDPDVLIESTTNIRQSTASTGKRPTKDGRKTAHSSAVAAYTQNVPQIVLQPTRKGNKVTNASPRIIRDTKVDLRADIRAVYGTADVPDRPGTTQQQRPRSQKPHPSHTGHTSSSHARNSDETIGIMNIRSEMDSQPTNSSYHDEIADVEVKKPVVKPTSAYATSNSSATRSTSASRLRMNPNTIAAASATKSTTSRRAVGGAPGSANSSTRPTAAASVPFRPSSHNTAVITPSQQQNSSNTTTNQRSSLAENPVGGSSNNTGSAHKRTVKKAPTASYNPSLLKSSLTHTSKSPKSDALHIESDDIDSDHTGESFVISDQTPSKANASDNNPIQKRSDRHDRRSAGNERTMSLSTNNTGITTNVSSPMEAYVKERANTANAKVMSSRSKEERAQCGLGYSYTQSAGVAGATGLTGVIKQGDKTAPPLQPSTSMKSAQLYKDLEGPSGRCYSRSPESNLPLHDSDNTFVDIIHDTDIMESSFDESPILAAYLQEKSNTALHIKTTTGVTSSQHTDEKKDNSTARPQSRKLYLGADKDTTVTSSNNTNTTTTTTKSYKTAPRSAGARYSVPENPITSPEKPVGSPSLRKMSSFSEFMPQSRTWNETSSTDKGLPMRPPSRQSSAFPVHLANEPPKTAVAIATSGTTAIRNIDHNSSSISNSSSQNGSQALRVTTKTSSPKASTTNPGKLSSMRWSNADDDLDVLYDDDEIQSIVYDQSPISSQQQHQYCDVESNPNSETDTPRGRANSILSAAKLAQQQASVMSSAVNSVHTSLSMENTLPSSAQVHATTGTTTASATAVTTISPTREHISIIRSSLEDEVDVPTYELQRPPSRQKIAAQHLFDGIPPPSRIGTENTTGGGCRNKAIIDSKKESNTEDNTVEYMKASSRSTTVPRTHNSSYNPRDDGFADLEVSDQSLPFTIKYNTNDSPDKFQEEFESLHMSNRPLRRSYHSLAPVGALSNSASHSRSSSNASNSWDQNIEPDAHLLPLSVPRPQTVAAHVGPVKSSRILGVYPPTTATSNPNPVATVNPGRSKTSESHRSPTAGGGIPPRREGNSHLLSPAQPNSIASHKRGTPYIAQNYRNEYNAAPPAGGFSGRSGGWTDSGSDYARNPRSQNARLVESTSSGSGMGAGSYEHNANNYSLAPSSSSQALALPQRPAVRSVSHSSSHEYDSADEEDNMTILTEDSGGSELIEYEHGGGGMEAGMSMHSLALDSSLGEDFLSLFAPGP